MFNEFPNLGPALYGVARITRSSCRGSLRLDRLDSGSLNQGPTMLPLGGLEYRVRYAMRVLQFRQMRRDH